jgi:hypothetical protein
MISNTSSTQGTPHVPIPPERGHKPVAAPAPAADVLQTGSVDHLRAALAATPEVRAEVVEHGHKLAVDPNYPPREIIDDVARMIVDSQDLSTGD